MSEHVQIGRYCGICGVHVGRFTATCSGRPITGEEVERVGTLKEHPDWLEAEIADLRSKLEAAEGRTEELAAKSRAFLEAESSEDVQVTAEDLQGVLDEPPRRIERALDELRCVTAEEAVRRAIAILTEPANAEGGPG